MAYYKQLAFVTYGAPVIDAVARWGGNNSFAVFNPAGWMFDNANPTAVGNADLAIDPAYVLAQ
jgi:hypothetical protein